MVWNVDQNPPLPPKDSKAFVDLINKPTQDDLKIWRHSFEFRLRVNLSTEGDHLMLTSSVRNTDTKPLIFTFAYHNHLSVSKISEVRVEGLRGLLWLDKLEGMKLSTEEAEASIAFDEQVYNIYLNSVTEIAVIDRDGDRQRTIEIRKDGLPDIVVWHPGDNDNKGMLCLGAAAAENVI